MRIAIIGNFDKGSYAECLAKEINKTHTSHIYNTRELGYDQSIVHNISSVLEKDKDIIEHIIVVQSHVFLHNDTDIPLYLYKRELGNPTVDNPTKVFRKYLLFNDKKNYECVLEAAINPSRYNPNREKDILISDIPSWHWMGFQRYVDILERSKFHIVKALSMSVRTLEALACKTIPIIFYTLEQTRLLYEEMGITSDIAHFVEFSNWQRLLQIKEYDIDMATRGYEFCMKHLTIANRAKQILRVIENG